MEEGSVFFGAWDAAQERALFVVCENGGVSDNFTIDVPTLDSCLNSGSVTSSIMMDAYKAAATAYKGDVDLGPKDSGQKGLARFASGVVDRLPFLK